jgi:hypothetical protein
MSTYPLSELESYNPSRLIDSLLNNMRLKNDFQLSQALDISASCISKIRNGHMAVSAQTLIAMHETSGLSIRELRSLMGDTRKFFKATWYRKRCERYGISTNERRTDK